MVTKMFKKQLGRNMEAYIDNMVVKSKVMGEHLFNLAETFETLYKHYFKLNASKCAFRVSSGKFLGYLVTNRGIEVNLDHIIALQNQKPPRNPKEVQCLTGMTTALNRFISRSADMIRPFIQVLKKWKDFRWLDKCQVAFDELKLYLSQAPILSRSVVGETLYMYLAVLDHTVSVVLIRLDQDIQKPIFYVSKTLMEMETHYIPLEKAILALIHVTQKMPHYFQVHTVIVLTKHPLQALLKRADFLGRIVK